MEWIVAHLEGKSHDFACGIGSGRVSEVLIYLIYDRRNREFLYYIRILRFFMYKSRRFCGGFVSLH